ncbi:hypothetical protein M422DRAFT_61507 [Sphaerobolus stellatus SS14]|uniref:tRNA (cytosine(38)-C(5))-methyltransferase n=1 Tax=Sphaerobolus stellatus (strain SS14) TaxID=990650 RepID=A0A0C9V6D4_SPHS4|nr:hypothetical protein M422DRAFT_61507 [Sphaerobolus stellatus SS14]
MINTLEFYSGIGGLHLSLKRACIVANVVRAFDWDPAASEVYTANFGKGIAQRTDISQIQAADIIPLHADLWLLSPACQPYTVLNPAAKGAADPRARSFLHLVEEVIPALAKTGHHPKRLLVENVAGFESSTTRQTLVDTMKSVGYNVAEFLLTPLQFGIPNSRLRYYFLAKSGSLSFANLSQDSLSTSPIHRSIPGHGQDWVDPRFQTHSESETAQEASLPLSSYLDNVSFEKYAIPDKILRKKAILFDIVKPSAKRSCCFTRGYAHMIEGTTVLQMNEELDTTETFNAYAAAVERQVATTPESQDQFLYILRPLQLRYFTPDELLRIFHFNPVGVPTYTSGMESEKVEASTSVFHWPQSTSIKTRYRLIGNSVNVKVVTELIKYLFEGDELET